MPPGYCLLLQCRGATTGAGAVLGIGLVLFGVGLMAAGGVIGLMAARDAWRERRPRRRKHEEATFSCRNSRHHLTHGPPDTPFSSPSSLACVRSTGGSPRSSPRFGASARGRRPSTGCSASCYSRWARWLGARPQARRRVTVQRVRVLPPRVRHRPDKAVSAGHGSRRPRHRCEALGRRPRCPLRGRTRLHVNVDTRGASHGMTWRQERVARRGTRPRGTRAGSLSAASPCFSSRPGQLPTRAPHRNRTRRFPPSGSSARNGS
jgi:hypothetical protein